MFIQYFFIVLVIWYLIYRWRNRHFFKLAKRLHNSCIGPVLPIIGQSYLFVGNAEERMKTFNKVGKLTTEKGGVTALWQCFTLCICISDADIIEFVLKTFLEKDDLTEYWTIFFGNGSIFTSAVNWRPRRKATAPIFTQKNLKNFTAVFSHQSEILTNKLRGSADKCPITLMPLMNAYALDSICESTFGVSVDAQSENHHQFSKSFNKLTKLASDLYFQPYMHNKTIYKLYCHLSGAMKDAYELQDFVDNIIKEKRKKLEQPKPVETEPDQPLSRKEIPTFMELFMQSLGAGRKLTEVELREEGIVLVMAASDTSAVGASFAAMMIARHPEIQEKVHRELQEVIGTTFRSVTYEDLPRLKYLEAVIKESLRLYPPIPLVLRKVESDVTLPTGVTVHDGCTLVISIEAVHRNPKYWGEDANSFKPERFLGTTLPHPAAYMPFGYGPRNCVGYKYAMMSMTTVLGTILQQYEILPPDDSPDSGLNIPHDEATNPLRTYHSIMVKEVNDFTVKLKSRQ